jgi:hypothetical protein
MRPIPVVQLIEILSNQRMAASGPYPDVTRWPGLVVLVLETVITGTGSRRDPPTMNGRTKNQLGTADTYLKAIFVVIPLTSKWSELLNMGHPVQKPGVSQQHTKREPTPATTNRGVYPHNFELEEIGR